MKIEISTDWQEVCRKLRLEMNAVGYNADLHRMLSNIDKMVSELSKIEVEVRRTRSTVLYREHLVDINNAIDRLEKLIIMATLMR
jgi:hypothetical protein